MIEINSDSEVAEAVAVAFVNKGNGIPTTSFTNTSSGNIAVREQIRDKRLTSLDLIAQLQTLVLDDAERIRTLREEFVAFDVEMERLNAAGR